jgi:DNA-binding MarR family transcriptional regulator
MSQPSHGRGDLTALLSIVARSIDERLRDRLADLGYEDVRPAHLALLLNLERAGVRGSELARRAEITKQSMAELVRDLERLDYIERRPDPADGRARLVQPTGRGLILIAHARQALTEVDADAARRLGRERFTELRRSLALLARSPEGIGVGVMAPEATRPRAGREPVETPSGSGPGGRVPV